MSPDLLPATGGVALTSGSFDIGLLVTALSLGIRHGIDWDHIAAITDITSTSAAAEVADESHELDHVRHPHPGTGHRHGGPTELAAHGASHEAGHVHDAPPLDRRRFVGEERRAILLGTLYALGHASVVAVLGLAALLLGAKLPGWVDPIMGRVVGVTLLVLGAWVFYSLFQYARHGAEFRLRSRWMLLFGGFRYAWRWLAARLHGHTHVEPIEMSAYGPRTAFGVGVIHGIGAETGTQIVFIAAIATAAGVDLGIPMMVAFIIGLLISNTAIVIVTATGFVASQLRQRVYVGIGIVAGTFSVVVGTIFLFELTDKLPRLFG